MSTICCDGKTVAADGRSICGDSIVDTDFEKIILKDGRIFGVVGTAGSLNPVVAWILEGADPDKMPKIAEFSVVEFCKEGANLYRHDVPYADLYNYPCAFGSGQPFALAAMRAGAKPLEAVKIAAELDPGTGGTCIEISLDDLKRYPMAVQVEDDRQATAA